MRRTRVNRGVVRARSTDLIRHLRTPLYRNAYALVANSAVSAMLGLLYWVLVARLYSAEDVGRNSAVIASIIFLSGIAQLNLRPVLSRFIPVAGTSTGRFVAIAYFVSADAALVVGAVFVLGIQLWAHDSVYAMIRSTPFLAFSFIGMNVLWCIFGLQDGVLIGLRRSVAVLVENSLFGIAKIVFAVVFTLQAATRGPGIVVSWIIPMVIAIVVVNAAVFRKFVPVHVTAHPETSDLIEPRRIARFVAGDYLGSLFALAYASLLPVIIISQVGATKSAHFYIVWIISTSLQLVPLQMVTSLVVETAAEPLAFQRQARHLVVQIARILVPVGVILLIGASSILQIFGRGYAEDGAGLLRLLVLSLIPDTVIVLFFGFARVRARVRGIVAVQAALAASILGLSGLLLPGLGLTGVGIAYLASQTGLALFLLVTALRPVLRSSTVIARR